MGYENRSVLIIDDDPELRLILKKILENLGIEVFEASGIKEAWTIIDKHPPHLFILDLKLHNETGFDFLELRSRDDRVKNIPVLVCSAYGHKKSISLIKSYSVDDFLLKPIKQTWLIQKVRKIFSDAEKLSYAFAADAKMPSVIVTVEGHLSQISETSCIIRSPLRIAKKSGVKAEFKLFKEEGISCNMLESAYAGHLMGPGEYETTFTMLGLTESDAQKIRAKKSKWNLR